MVTMSELPLGPLPDVPEATSDPDALIAFEGRIARGDLSLRGLVAAGNFFHVTLPAELQPSLRNVNTLRDLESLGLGSDGSAKPFGPLE